LKAGRCRPTGEHGCEFPAEIDRVADTGIHAERAGGRQLMNGVAGKKNTSFCVSLGNHAAPRPHASAEPLDLERAPDCPTQIRLPVDRLRIEGTAGVEHHQAPHGIYRINDAHI
jgi:hypothetical protein